MMHESRMHADNLFVTLTYDQEHINDNNELVPSHFTKFIKHLRRRSPQKRFSFFGCGEYGERTARPHYHGLLFGFDFVDKLSINSTATSHAFSSRELDDVWGRGLAELGTVTSASAAYVAGYVRKKVRAQRYQRANPLTGELLEPEFARMSLRPAIGRRWIEKYWNDVYPRDFVVFDGRKGKPPRYYDKFMDQEHPLIMEEVRQKRCDEADHDVTRYTREAGEAIAEARTKLFARRAGV